MLLQIMNNGNICCIMLARCLTSESKHNRYKEAQMTTLQPVQSPQSLLCYLLQASSLKEERETTNKLQNIIQMIKKKHNKYMRQLYSTEYFSTWFQIPMKVSVLMHMRQPFQHLRHQSSNISFGKRIFMLFHYLV